MKKLTKKYRIIYNQNNELQIEVREDLDFGKAPTYYNDKLYNSFETDDWDEAQHFIESNQLKYPNQYA